MSNHLKLFLMDKTYKNIEKECENCMLVTSIPDTCER